MVFKSHFGTIIVFINLFEEEFDYVNCCIHFKIQIRVVFAEQIEVIKNRSTVINNLVLISNIWPCNIFCHIVQKRVIYIFVV